MPSWLAMNPMPRAETEPRAECHSYSRNRSVWEAAQSRNIEAGVLLEDPVFARALRRQFESLINRGHVKRLRRGLE